MKHIVPDMVEVPRGIIRLRDDRLKRSWEVKLQPFRLARYPVTQELYQAVTGHNPSKHPGVGRPVESVSWLEAVAFCNELSLRANLSPAYELLGADIGAILVDGSIGYRLPTEAEWEFACKAGVESPRYGELDHIAWYKGNSGGHPHEVGLKRPNEWGLHEMLGNVWEWCFDQYDPQVYGPYRIFRGGGWADEDRGCLATNRRRSHPTFSIDDVGFRLAQSRSSAA